MALKPILWVEDDPDDEALIRLALQELGVGHLVQFAGDGEQALSVLSGAAQPPQVIFLDFKLPKMDAPEVIERLRRDKRFELIPIVIFTSSKRTSDAERCMGPRGASCFVSKPAEFDGFKLTVRQLLQRWAPAAL
jgi:CheY-like chemotaxis protein